MQLKWRTDVRIDMKNDDIQAEATRTKLNSDISLKLAGRPESVQG